ncbi:MAG TPA: hypothetical protein VK579_15240 [Terriglobales bacterium]|nr:hypothetical protein [Terriglobales bacterium]
MSANEKTWGDWAGESTSPLIDESLRAGLALVWRASICAQDTGANVWDFALRTGRLYEVGMTSSDLRWMVAKGLAAHGEETSGYDDPHRSFRRSNGYFFNNHTCLILTPSGVALAEFVFRDTARSPQATLSALAAVASETAALANARQAAYDTTTPAPTARKPSWDATRRELYLTGLIVKRFRVPARNQETILSVFEEEGWAEHIHDPLPITHEIDAPTRLHDAINRLNRCQINPLLRFHGDGKGTGVFWELSQPDMG